MGVLTDVAPELATPGLPVEQAHQVTRDVTEVNATVQFTLNEW